MRGIALGSAEPAQHEAHELHLYWARLDIHRVLGNLDVIRRIGDMRRIAVVMMGHTGIMLGMVVRVHLRSGHHSLVARSAVSHGHARHPLNGKRDGDEPDDQEPKPDLHGAHSSRSS